MADEVTVKISGLDELQKALEALPLKVAKKDLRAVLRAGANVFKKEMVNTAPVESGFLEEHIDVRTRLRSDELAGTAFVGPNNKAVYPGRLSRWHARTARLVAGWLEFGTERMSKKPWLTQSFETQKEKVVEVVEQKLKEKLGL
jgi:HK97 gp10 family phage protein